MNIQNFKLNEIFSLNAKEYQTRPVKAMKYLPGIENGWMVYYSNKEIKGKEAMMHEGISFFPSEAEAWKFINSNDTQYVKENGAIIELEVVYDVPLPVLYREESDKEKNKGVSFQFGDKAFMSDESEKYEFYVLDSNWCDCDTWIIQDMDGNIRVWDRTVMDELFFGKEVECVYEKTDKGEYIQVAV